jgi:hypothetical protein
MGNKLKIIVSSAGDQNECSHSILMNVFITEIPNLKLRNSITTKYLHFGVRCIAQILHMGLATARH